MKINVEQRHIDAGIKLATADPFALAIKEELDKRPVPNGYLRVERVVSVSSSVLVTEHRIIKRKGREETDLAWEKYWLGAPAKSPNGGETYDLNNPEFSWIGDFDNGRPVKPTTIEIVEAR